MTIAQLWSIIRGRRTNYRWANASWTSEERGRYIDRDQMNVLDAVGPMLDAWDSLSNDERGSINQDAPLFVKHLTKLRYLAEAQ
ncbi:hypothetical protein [Bradyrhizobium sp.]|uniref:hypothetical protein n=1 Tax=Bradyrhizobium sp. TaxID=376 RepID=UPI0025C396C5|nr:hypothetical protein [Bradyrhizobium sp.]